MLYVNRFETCRVFITDTDDNITESIGYDTLFTYINNGLLKVYGVCIKNGRLECRVFKKNSIVINAVLGNEDAIKLSNEFSDLNTISLDSLSMQSNKEVLWHCNVCNSDYKSSPNKRLHSDKHRNCPYCAGQAVKVGFNDVATTHHYILKDWDFERNTIKPTDYTAGSGVAAYFKCSLCGCSYSSPISTKTRLGREELGCPDCAARRNIRGYSLNEKYLYDFLSQYYHCKDRVHFDSLEFDIYIPSLRVLIEYDGNYWHEFDNKIKRDLIKNEYASKNNFILIRVRESNLSSLTGCINILMKDFNSNIKLVSSYLLDLLQNIASKV